MAAVLESDQRTACMAEAVQPHCGDGEVGQGEECDCGQDCLAPSSCCQPHTGGDIQASTTSQPAARTIQHTAPGRLHNPPRLQGTPDQLNLRLTNIYIAKF